MLEQLTELQQILPVGEDEKDLYEALDGYMVGAVEYTTEKGHRTVAEQSRWFKKLPRVLMLQQNVCLLPISLAFLPGHTNLPLKQRVKFDASSGTYKKLNTPLRFDKEVFMDRYFLEHREQTTQTRRIVAEWRAELAVRDKQIKSITNYKVQG